MKVLFALTLVAALAATPAIAQTWIESPDAGCMPGLHQVPVGTNPFTTILGSCTADFFNGDMYCISIPDPTAFVATTTNALTTIDTQLFLFDMNGIGITFNDDNPAGGLQSMITGQFLPGPGEYLLTISSGWNHDPTGPTGAEIWLDSPYNVERVPDGPDAPGPISGWISSPNAGDYQIDMIGVLFCGTTPVEPTSWGTIKAMYR